MEFALYQEVQLKSTHYLMHSIDVEYGMTVLASVIEPRLFALAIELPSQRSSERLRVD
jgi:hypothetical protein